MLGLINYSYIEHNHLPLYKTHKSLAKETRELPKGNSQGKKKPIEINIHLQNPLKAHVTHLELFVALCLINSSQKVEVKEVKDMEEDNGEEDGTKAKGQGGWSD